MTTRHSQAQANLPPRCPIQRKSSNVPIPDSLIQHVSSLNPTTGENYSSWFDDLQADKEMEAKGGLRPLRRTVSDPVTLLDSVSAMGHHFDEGNSGKDQTCGSFESDSSMYGPNSPRLRSASSLSESAIISALSNCVPQEQGVDDHVVLDCELNADARAAKRHPGQRSRIRKLQYIAELERTVDCLMSLESDLAVRVASLLQRRVALSIENSKLKQQMVKMRRDKLIVDGEYQILKKEVRRLQGSVTHGQIRTCYVPNSEAEAMKMMSDMDNLNLY